MVTGTGESQFSSWMDFILRISIRNSWWKQILAVYFSILLLTEVYAEDISSFDSRKHKSSLTKSLNGRHKDTDRFSVMNFDTSSTTTQSTTGYPTEDGPYHVIRRLEKKRLRRGKIRGERSGINRGQPKWRSCQTKSTFSYKEKAVDVFGHHVQVYPYIHIGDISIDQYFYEAFCDAEKCECSGIDNKKFKSSCETDYTYTYAKVIKSGEIGWTHIKVRSGCSCRIHKVDLPQSFNIMDLLK